jgi:hypothetical protein
MQVPGALLLDAVVDAAIALMLSNCNVTPASAPALARLIRSGALIELGVWSNRQQLLGQPAAALIADALRANSTLTSLKLESCRFWEDAAGAALILGALKKVSFNLAPALSAALGALVAADAPALHVLEVPGCSLGVTSMGALIDALPRNTHLRKLNLEVNGCTEAFMRDRLLPAVRANTSLQHLTAVGRPWLQYEVGEVFFKCTA